MENDIKKIKCPKCGTSISIDDVLTHQIEDKLKQGFKDREKALRESMNRLLKKSIDIPPLKHQIKFLNVRQ